MDQSVINALFRRIGSTAAVVGDDVAVLAAQRRQASKGAMSEEEIEQKIKQELKKTAMALSTKSRADLPASDFALPEVRKYPIHDVSHARNALARVAQHGDAALKAHVQRLVFARYPELKK